MKHSEMGLLPQTLYKLRKQYKHTQKELADLLGVSIAMYSKIELGERAVKAEYIPMLARFLGSDTNDLYSLYLADKFSSESQYYPKQVVDKAFDLIQNQERILV